MIEFSMNPIKNMREVWRDVIGYEELYQVSSLGSVERKKRVGTDRRGNRMVLTKKTLQSFSSKRGYQYVTLHRQGKGIKYCLHRLVAFSFFPDSLQDQPVKHKDGKRENNRLDNLLFFMTLSDFIQSPILEKKLIQELTDQPTSLLSPEDEELVKWICQPGSRELGMAALARCYGVEIQDIKQILEREACGGL